MSGLWRVCFPSREGIKGCVTVRGAVWAEVFLPLFGEVVFLGLRVTALVFRRLCLDVTHPRPLSRGEVCGACFLLVMSGLSGEVSPLERGLWGVLR